MVTSVLQQVPNQPIKDMSEILDFSYFLGVFEIMTSFMATGGKKMVSHMVEKKINFAAILGDFS